MGLLDRARSDFIQMRALARVVGKLPWLVPFGHWNAARLLSENADRHPNGLALAFQERRFTWRELDQQANRYAHFFLSEGVSPGDVVSLMMDNRPEFLFSFLGLNRIRAVGALINTNLRGKGLAHAIRVAEPKKVFAGSEHVAPLSDVLPEIESLSPDKDVMIQLDEGDEPPASLPVVNERVAAAPTDDLSGEFVPDTSERMCFIYTSGTTGLPKAAIISNQRFLTAAAGFGLSVFEASPEDVLYVTLPLYHSSAQFLGLGTCLTTGAALALRRRFSASNFWKDAREFNATHFLYIGELCRYLLNQPEQPDERKHSLRMGAGNGMRPDIWEKFQERFGVPLIREFYGATEGNAAIMNIEGRPGMVGRLGPGQVLVRCDPATGELRRNEEGFCETVGAGDQGILLGRISAVLSFDGYLDREATDKKIEHDVLKKGDAWFNTGDLLDLHPNRWVSFADRVGDTFRWKGENVSTNEVAESLNGAPGVLESNVYGVALPGSEGRCGMAALNVSDAFDVQTFAHFVTDNLPNYQRPYFVRVQHGMQVTTTFKHQKVDYRTEGFDPRRVKDPLFFFDGSSYVAIDEALYAKLESGEIGPR